MAFIQDNHPMPTTFGIKNDVFRLFTSQLFCYFIAIVYNKFLVKRSIQLKHLSNVVFGLLICYYNFGNHVIHSLMTCFISWTIIKILGPTIQMVIVNFTFTMGYLMYGYYDKDSSQTTHFTWTLPQCVLTLSLIALAFDLYDWQQNLIAKKKGSPMTNEDTAFEHEPTLLELLSKVYFPPSFLIGPQVRYKDFIEFTQCEDNLLPLCWKYSLSRFCLGVLYFGVFHSGQTYIPADYFFTDQFVSAIAFITYTIDRSLNIVHWQKSHGFITKLTLLAIFNKANICKYIAGWLIAEGACIMYGISRDPTTGQMNRCFNVSVIHFETTTTFGGLIESFNMTTNAFALRYVFKRLKGLRSKLASQFVTLFFLAIWHGFPLGYYNTFALEMMMMKMEKDV
ncbi:Lysophosphatidylcholine acyltransferase 3 [Blomia tropicalis]|nr:Lysophosphatidylcholine acyltransferase 3 [Blomia tropicalis]